MSAESLRNLSPAEIGERVGHRGTNGLWRPFGKRNVTKWCTQGFGDSKCPHDRVVRGKRDEILMCVEEVLEWRKAQGMPAELKPEGAGETIESGGPLIEAGKAEAQRREAEGERRKAEEAAALRAMVAELVGEDPRALLKKMLVDLKLKIDALDRDTSSQTFQQLSGAASNIGRDLRLLESNEREAAEQSGRLIERTVALRLIGDLASAVRMQFTAQGAVIGAKVLAAVEGVEGEEARQRVAAIAAQAVVDQVLLSLADGAERAAAELQGMSDVGRRMGDGGGLFGVAA